MVKTFGEARALRFLLACMLVGAVSVGLVADAGGDDAVSTAWVVRYDGPTSSYDGAYALAVDAAGNVYVTGFGNSTTFDYVTAKYDAGGNELWSARYDGDGGGLDWARDIGLDSSGNVYVTGYSQGNGGDYDYATVKYDGGGNETWARRYDGPVGEHDFASRLAVDGGGNVYVAGYSKGSGSGVDYATVKYDADGNELWVARYDGPAGGTDQAYAVALDGGGNAFVTGLSRANGDDFDYATVRYDSSGNETWARRYDGPAVTDSEDVAQDMALDAAGNVYVTGWSRGNNTAHDILTLKYTSSGEELWAARYHGGDYDIGVGLCVDGSGNVYVAGSSQGSGTSWDYLTAKYDAGGNQTWARRYDGPASGSDQAYGIGLDGSGNVYVTGRSEGGATGTDYATLKYDADGNLDWTRRYDGPASGEDYAFDIAVGDNGDVYVTGQSLGSTGYDFATVKYVPFIFGDADEDGDVDVADWILTRLIILGTESSTPGADADQDGDVDAFDWVKIKRIILGLDA